MKILLFKTNTFMQNDLEVALKKICTTLDTITYAFRDYYKDDFFAAKLENKIKKENYDYVFSLNYWPVISEVCDICNTLYIAWSYDCPTPFLRGLERKCNRLFVFDRAESEALKNNGFENVFYLPLAVNTDRLDNLFVQNNDFSDKYNCVISFVGSLYQKKTLRSRNIINSDFFLGLFEGCAAAQSCIYNTDILDELLSNIQNKYHEDFPTDFSWENLKSQLMVDCTNIERKRLLTQLSKFFPVTLYSLDSLDDPNIIKKSSVNYYTEMPAVFRNSLINLQITLKTITTGLSARVFDIMGSHGFLMSNPQPELFELFEPYKDFVFYESTEDLIDKCSYYLNHENERKQIALNGYQKVKNEHTYDIRLRELFELL